MYDARPKPPRKHILRGEEHPHARLTARQVLCIRAQAEKARLRHKAAGRGRHIYPRGFIRALAAAYAISIRTVYELLTRRRWGHV